MQRVSLQYNVACGSSPRLSLLVGQTALFIFHQEAKQEEAKPAGRDVSPKAAEEVDLNATRHQGQVALRRLYHESKRPLVVFYSSPSCGPCRSLKPIMYKLTDEFQDKVGPFHLWLRWAGVPCPALVSWPAEEFQHKVLHRFKAHLTRWRYELLLLALQLLHVDLEPEHCCWI